jgi:arylsulfatase A-like enzyme
MNVLIFYTDQQQRRSLGAYGNPIVRTPNLDRLATEATVFENAICTLPVCVPSRCSIFSGTWPHTHGVFDNYHPLPRHIQTLAEMLIDHGFRTGFIGKWHMGREVLPQRGFEEFYHAVDDVYTSDRDFPLYGPCGYSRWLIEKGYKPDSQEKPGRFSRAFTARLPEEDGKAAFISEQACRFLECRRSEPFCLVCSFLEPHNPYHSPYDGLHDPADIPLPSNFHSDPLPDWPKRSARFQQWCREVAHEDGVAYDSEDKWRRLMARYYGMCHLVDRHAGRVLDKLDALGLRDSTMVIYTSDHGDMMASHGMYLKSMMLEEAQGVPLLIRHPNVLGGRRVVEPTSQVDIVPTILDALGVRRPAGLDGRSLMPLLRAERGEDPDAFAVCEWNGVIQNLYARLPMFADVKGLWIRSIRTRRWKLNVNCGDVSELYDLGSDPGEMRNRVDDANCRPVIEDLFARLQAWQHEAGDVVALPHPLHSAGSPPAGLETC